MPEIKVLYWNIENFGDGQNGRRGNYVPLCNFITSVVRNVDADVLCLMELRRSGTRAPIFQLQTALINAYNLAGVQTAEWHCDWVPGSLTHDAMSLQPYDPNRVGFTGQGRNEGYAIFWKQNIAKFVMMQADPHDNVAVNPPGFLAPAPGFTPNTQSDGVRIRVAPVHGGIQRLPGNMTVHGGAGQFHMPAGTNVGAGGIGPILAGPTAVGVNLNAGAVIPLGTAFNGGPMTLNAPVLGVHPILIPSGYTLTADFPLPAAGTVLLTPHVLSLVMSARPVDADGHVAIYNPGPAPPPNAWNLGLFPGTAGADVWNGCRRPAYCTIQVTGPGALANRLVPITFYHTPVSRPAVAMQRAAISRQAYEVYDRSVPGFTQNHHAMVGGDLNARLDPAAQHYAIYAAPMGPPGGFDGGADFNYMGHANIRVHQPAPAAAPAFPPPPAVLTPANNPENKSTVQLRDPIIGRGRQVLSNNIDHYRRSAIDNILYRGLTPAQSPRQDFYATVAGGVQQTFQADLYDLVRAVSGVLPPGAGVPANSGLDNFFIPAAIVQAFQGLPVWPIGGFVGGAGGGIIGLNGIENPAQLYADIGWGVFLPVAALPGGGPPAGPPGQYTGPAPIPTVITEQRRAAEFIKKFVSDHLPVIFTVNL